MVKKLKFSKGAHGFCQKLKLFLFEHVTWKKKVFNNVPKSKQTILDEKNVYLGMVIKTDLFQRV